MSLLINIRLLQDKNLSLQGELTPTDLELDSVDELIHVTEPLAYDLEAQKNNQNILVQGSLRVPLDCECARCLKPFQHRLTLPQWVCHIPLQGEESAQIVRDCLDLTPYLREDILLAFPQHPLCEPDCGGLSSSPQNPVTKPGGFTKSKATPSAWAELNKLKFDK